MLKNINTLLVLLVVIVTVSSCKDDVIPKPKSHLRLEYPMPKYEEFDGCHYIFGYNTIAKIKDKGNCNFNIEYPGMKATIYLNYKPVNNNIEALLKDAQRLTYEHVIKADDIIEQPFENKKNKVYGMFYEVDGNAASQTQFYLTDSVHNFVIGSVYFYVKPNYDSILPASSYLRNDIQNLMESLQWK
ncbi:gliding motility lipoprotein GldD [Flavobacterium sp. '19STA2R22 D10 B1']|uniref:gliding motility lipoprotein GldD n=1 Tax=Flavobacterium aerium TaxID=3037261 RepID=UPI00278BD8AD|nr:gliding motility lipoprotein GldD [Flavobacterium sp. '19STA2R22 D10 B1']